MRAADCALAMSMGDRGTSTPFQISSLDYEDNWRNALKKCREKRLQWDSSIDIPPGDENSTLLMKRGNGTGSETGPAIPASGSRWPSRKREEAQALLNLQRRIAVSRAFRAGLRSPQAPGAESGDEQQPSTSSISTNPEQVDNRPHLLKRFLSNHPFTIENRSNECVTDWQDSEFITECLNCHNAYRQRHGAPPLNMSPQLCSYAQSWANHLAHTNTFYYRNDREVGQNLFCRPINSIQSDVAGQEVASYWYSAVRSYSYLKEPDVLHANVNAGHFTQMVWVGTTHFGVGKARSRAGKVLVVANYRPVGNVSGMFEENVLPPVCLNREDEEMTSGCESVSGSMGSSRGESTSRSTDFGV